MADLHLASQIKAARGWDNALRHIMLAGKSLSLLSETQRDEKHYIKGCDSDVWLSTIVKDKYINIAAYSPSKIIRGVLAVIIEKAESMPTAELAEFDFEAYLLSIGMQKYLSESRGNGVKHVVDAIKSSGS